MDQQNFVIITDVTTDFTPEMVQQLGIDVIPMEFMIDDISYMHYPDEREMTMDEFYTRVKSGKMPTTTQITKPFTAKPLPPFWNRERISCISASPPA